MATEIRVPTLGESVAEATVGRWLKQSGESVAADEPIVELETDKVSVEVPSPIAGTLEERTVGEGETVEVGALLGMVGDGSGASVGAKPGRANAEAPAGSSSEGVSGGDDPIRSAAPDAKPVVEEARGTNDGAMERRGAVDDATAANGKSANTGANSENGKRSEPMAANLVQVDVPSAGESVTEAEVGTIFKRVGDSVSVDEPILELETDKAAQDVMSPVAGVIRSLAVSEGDTVEVGAKLVEIEEGGSASSPSETAGEQGPSRTDPTEGRVSPGAEGAPQTDAPRAADQAAYGNAGAGAQNNEALEQTKPVDADQPRAGSNGANGTTMPPSPSAARMMEERGVSADQVEGSGRRGQVLKGDVMAALDRLEKREVEGKAPEQRAKSQPSSQPSQASPQPSQASPQPSQSRSEAPADGDGIERVKMTRLRQTIARRLKEAQDTAAMLTTFNEVDMSAVMDMRKKYKELFEKKHSVKLGFMGFFTKAVCHALKEIPAVNAEIDGKDIVYKNFAHIGVAVGTDKGLVVPVVRNADQMSIAEIEKEIGRLGRAARDGELSMSDMQGGTFTISNGGVYGSLMSTPILNAPQSGILGMHKIQERPMAIGGEVLVRPMMYLALSYDHRIVDGKEAVTFLVRVKESLEDPERLVLDL